LLIKLFPSSTKYCSNLRQPLLRNLNIIFLELIYLLRREEKVLFREEEEEELILNTFIFVFFSAVKFYPVLSFSAKL